MSRNTTLQFEAHLVGAVMSNPDFFSRAAFLTHDAFNDPACATLWKIICDERMNGGSISPVALAARHTGAIEKLGGIQFLNRICDLAEQILPVFNEVVDRIHEEAQWRRISTISARLAAAVESREKTPEQILSGLESLARNHLSSGRSTTRTKSQVARDAINAALVPRDVIITGIESLDFMMQGGIWSKRLYGIGGLYGRGKTVMLGSISDILNRQEVPHLFISLETPPEDIEVRSCAKFLQINSADIYDTQSPNHEQFINTAHQYTNTITDHTFYDFSPQATMDEIHRKILSAKMTHGIKGFIIDYWQLIRGRGRGQTEEAHLNDCADRLAAICRLEDMWGIVAAQVDERGRLKKADGLYQSASLYLRLVREENDSAAYFVTEKSNYTRYTDNGNESNTTMYFDDQVGPHFRNTTPEDMPALAGREHNITL